ncbi:MAG TPA: YnbE family lipoprotein [Allosphingosinicella sp.]|uniref:YnbE family lipoprotein n=1 Tax=Allosphingosinicella sp. TaxID=2823234 RepID=UPI002EDAEBE3
MKEARIEKVRLGTTPGKILAGVTAIAALPGCVEISAPDKPIEINLNINIRQEVVVRLTEDVRELRQREPGVF